MSIHPLDIPAGEVLFTKVVSPEHYITYPKGIYSGLSFFQKLYSSDVAYFNAITYTASDKLPILLPLHKLILCIGCCAAAKETRSYVNIHSKVYITYSANHIPMAAFCGSQNLVLPSTENLMIDVSAHKQFFHEYFLNLWEKAEKQTKQTKQTNDKLQPNPPLP